MKANQLYRSVVVAVLGVLGSLGWTVQSRSAEPEELKGGLKSKDIIAKVRAGWDKNRQRIHSIECSGVRETTYLKGGYTNTLSQINPPNSKLPACPDRDLIFSNEPFRWSIDFHQSRIRRDVEFTSPYFTQGSTEVPFQKKLDVDIVANGEYRFFHSDSDGAPKKGSDWVVQICPKVLRFLSFDSLPLLWLAGGVSAQNPGPAMLQQYDDVGNWSVKGVAQLDGKDCYVITMPEQLSGGSMVREFWVLAKEPFPVLSCSVKSQRGVAWKLDATYTERDGNVVLSTISYVEYQYPSASIVYKLESRFDEFYINRAIDDSVFDKKLEPGMAVYFQGKREKFEVDQGGNIVPSATEPSVPKLPKSNRTRLVMLVASAAVVGFILIAFVWRWRYRRLNSASGESENVNNP